MEGYTFHHEALADGSQFLFNQVDHLRLQIPEGWHTFYVLHRSSKAAIIHFHLGDRIARSPFNAPFGSIEFNNLPPKTLFDFLAYFGSELKTAGAQKIIIKDAPGIFRPTDSAILHTFLLNQGYRVALAEVSSVIGVDAEPIDEKLASRKKRKLKQVKASGFEFQSVRKTHWKDVYRFIADKRRAKGYSLSMSEEDLGRTIETFPERFKFFTVSGKNKTAAACVAVIVRKDILYAFYSDHDSDFDSMVPSLALYDGIYRYCREKSIRWIDLGTSALAGVPNFGLLNFKLQLGAVPSAKLTLEKDITE